MDKIPSCEESKINKESFLALMKTTGFHVELYQKRLIITTEEDVPFQAINTEIH